MTLQVDPASVVPGWGFGTGIDDFGLISTVATDSTGRISGVKLATFRVIRREWSARGGFCMH